MRIPLPFYLSNIVTTVVMYCLRLITILGFSVIVINCRLLSEFQPTKLPSAKYGYNPKFKQSRDMNEVTRLTIDEWDFDTSASNAWELSGLQEGDIMVYENDRRNGLLAENYRWPNATVPFLIDEDDFGEFI